MTNGHDLGSAFGSAGHRRKQIIDAVKNMFYFCKISFMYLQHHLPSN